VTVDLDPKLLDELARVFARAALDDYLRTVEQGQQTEVDEPWHEEQAECGSATG